MKLLSQRWPRDAPYAYGCPENFQESLTTPTATFPEIAFVPIEPINVHAKFEIRSFTRSWYNRGYPKHLGSPWIRVRFLFSKIFHGLLFGWTPRDVPYLWQPWKKWAWSRSRSRDPVNFWALNTNSFKTAKDTNIKFGRRVPMDSPDMTPDKRFRYVDMARVTWPRKFLGVKC